MSATDELLPCPFCGSEAEIMSSSDGFTSIGCRYCNPIFGVMLQKTSRAEAIAAWNRRAMLGRPTATKLVHGDGIVGHCDCSACGATIDFYDSYCRRCGAKFKEAYL